MKESAINRKIQRLLADKGAYVVKTIATNRAGVPDILACLDGKFIAIEGKTATGVVSRLQEAHLRQIKAAGGVAVVAKSVDEVRDLLIKLQKADLPSK